MFAHSNFAERRGTRWRDVELRVKVASTHYAFLGDQYRRELFLRLFPWSVSLQDLPIYINVISDVIRDGDAFSSDDFVFYKWEGLTKMLEVLEDSTLYQ